MASLNSTFRNASVKAKIGFCKCAVNNPCRDRVSIGHLLLAGRVVAFVASASGSDVFSDVFLLFASTWAADVDFHVHLHELFVTNSPTPFIRHLTNRVQIFVTNSGSSSIVPTLGLLMKARSIPACWAGPPFEHPCSSSDRQSSPHLPLSTCGVLASPQDQVHQILTTLPPQHTCWPAG